VRKEDINPGRSDAARQLQRCGVRTRGGLGFEWYAPKAVHERYGMEKRKEEGEIPRESKKISKISCKGTIASAAD